MAHPGGRPTIYSEEMVELVCQEIATNATGLDHICAANPAMPGCSTIKTWIRKYPEFRAKYLQAKEIQSHALMEKSLCVADRDEHDSSDSLLKINRDKLKVDTYKYYAARLNARDYGDKKEIKHDVDIAEKAESIRKVRNAESEYNPPTGCI
jgi:hypothetical protein